ncbi:hypothetical protein LAZ67_5003708 [Cordylochernes scorpioides]|uniref:BPTI/Kunitz inhibitor domain-containing protein n=1 Tax=Cordylochernes scorpioides TaxID=51811 RepID=A0ABY6KII5_9ARAC|nr:hypothetical protein LAZ67_5003708 [Cordylochernes scorpioides]
MQPLEKGTCRGHFQRYFYNKKSKRCQSFTYTGCRGNTNNFFTMAECHKACMPSGYHLVILPQANLSTSNSLQLTDDSIVVGLPYGPTHLPSQETCDRIIMASSAILQPPGVLSGRSVYSSGPPTGLRCPPSPRSCPYCSNMVDKIIVHQLCQKRQDNYGALCGKMAITKSYFEARKSDFDYYISYSYWEECQCPWVGRASQGVILVADHASWEGEGSGMKNAITISDQVAIIPYTQRNEDDILGTVRLCEMYTRTHHEPSPHPDPYAHPPPSIPVEPPREYPHTCPICRNFLPTSLRQQLCEYAIGLCGKLEVLRIYKNDNNAQLARRINFSLHRTCACQEIGSSVCARLRILEMKRGTDFSPDIALTLPSHCRCSLFQAPLSLWRRSPGSRAWDQVVVSPDLYITPDSFAIQSEMDSCHGNPYRNPVSTDPPTSSTSSSTTTTMPSPTTTSTTTTTTTTTPVPTPVTPLGAPSSPLPTTAPPPTTTTTMASSTITPYVQPPGIYVPPEYYHPAPYPEVEQPEYVDCPDNTYGCPKCSSQPPPADRYCQASKVDIKIWQKPKNPEVMISKSGALEETVRDMVWVQTSDMEEGTRAGSRSKIYHGIRSSIHLTIYNVEMNKPWTMDYAYIDSNESARVQFKKNQIVENFWSPWKMTISEPKSAHLREVLLFAFNWKKSATEAHRMLEEVYGDHALSKSQCYRWFKKFQSGDFELDN